MCQGVGVCIHHKLEHFAQESETLSYQSPELPHLVNGVGDEARNPI